MFEELLEDIAQKNALREVNTYLKLTAGLGAIILCLLSSSFIPNSFWPWTYYCCCITAKLKIDHCICSQL